MGTNLYKLTAIGDNDEILIDGVEVPLLSIDNILVVYLPNMGFVTEEETTEICSKFSELFPDKCVIITHEELKFFKLENTIPSPSNGE